MAKPPPWKPYEQPSDTTRELKTELRRRGLSDDEVEAATRKKKRRKALEFAVVSSRHLAQPEPNATRSYAAAYKGVYRTGSELVTVEHAAERLMLHPKTVLRFIREGRLPARRVGKAYRIARTDLEAFSGLPPRAEPEPEPPWSTVVVDVPGADLEAERRLREALNSALADRPPGAAPLRGQIISEPERRQLRIILVGEPTGTAALLGRVAGWLAEPAG